MTIRPDGITFWWLCLAKCPTSVAIISQVKFILFHSRYAPASNTFAFHEGIAAANILHVQYFEGEDSQDKYDDFYMQSVRVNDIAVLSFPETVQKLLVTYTRNVLKNLRLPWCGPEGF